MFMLLNAPNLTRGAGGVAAGYSDDAAWVRAIRHGLNPQGRALVIMPSEVFYFLSDEDLGALVAYVKSLPPVERSFAAPQPSVAQFAPPPRTHSQPTLAHVPAPALRVPTPQRTVLSNPGARAMAATPADTGNGSVTGWPAA